MTAEENASSIATVSVRTYLARMVASRVFRLLTMLAVLLMPFGMLGGDATAMGHQAASAMAEHCAAMSHKQKKGEPAKGADCLLACAAIASEGARFEHAADAPFTAEASRLTAAVGGLHPEAATPPPRTA